MYYLVCPVGKIGGKQELLTYASPNELNIGQAVEIPYGNKNLVGIVFSEAKKPSFDVKQIIRPLNEQLPEALMNLAHWMSNYYAARLPQILQTMLPAGMGKVRRGEFAAHDGLDRDEKHIPNQAQKKAISSIANSSKTTHLLHGVTGSGKTLVYRELAKKVIASNRSVIVLVPEISLTPQLASQFLSVTPNVIVLHSKLTAAQRHLAWKKISASDKPTIIIGPRSALFAPITSLGLIVIDECHEPSYTQDSQPKYSALRTARTLADLHKAKLVLGSATPSVADYYYATKTQTPIISLPSPTKKYQRDVVIIDAKKSEQFTKNRLLSNPLLEAIEQSLKNGEQTLLFHNRRATARLALCSQCGWSAECTRCHVPMRLHHDKHQLKCHICGLRERLPSQCPSCKRPDIEFRGFGSKRIEQDIRKLYPQATVARFDSDTPEKEQIHARYDELVNNKIDIIIGTQGLAKGLDLPQLSTIGVISSDTELYVPDFSSSERSFQLISQVIGRAGRAGQKSRVFIQSLNPEHFVVQAAQHQNFGEFYSKEIETRRAGHLPPFTFMLQLQIGYKSITTAENHCYTLKTELKKRYPNITVYEPTPAFHAYRSGLHFMQLVVTSQKRSTLVEIAKNVPQKWHFTLDPSNLL